MAQIPRGNLPVNTAAYMVAVIDAATANQGAALAGMPPNTLILLNNLLNTMCGGSTLNNSIVHLNNLLQSAMGIRDTIAAQINAIHHGPVNNPDPLATVNNEKDILIEMLNAANNFQDLIDLTQTDEFRRILMRTNRPVRAAIRGALLRIKDAINVFSCRGFFTIPPAPGAPAVAGPPPRQLWCLLNKIAVHLVDAGGLPGATPAAVQLGNTINSLYTDTLTEIQQDGVLAQYIPAGILSNTDPNGPPALCGGRRRSYGRKNTRTHKKRSTRRRLHKKRSTRRNRRN